MTRGASHTSGAWPTETRAQTAAPRSNELASRRSSRSRTTPSFRQVDVARALKGARAGGLSIGRVEIDPAGKIVLFTKSEPSEPLSPLEKWKQDHGAR